MNGTSRRGIAALVVLVSAAPISLASLSILSGPQQGTHVGNLVTNGSFETGAPAINTTVAWATGTSLTPFAVPPGWTSSGSSNAYAYWGGTGAGPYQVALSDNLPDGQNGLYFGNNFTDIDKTPTWNANGTVSFSGTPTFSPVFGSPVTLSQTVATNASPAATYILSFWASGENAAFASWADGIFGLRVTNVLAGDPIQYLTCPGGMSALGASHRFEFQFTPLNPLAPVTIEFINWGHLKQWPDVNGQPTGAFTSELVLDDVIINAIPAPGLSGIALAGLPLFARRRR
ncbi:MAG: hypothetical protein U0573_03820 [Phycisphaerales bacterium]|nr:hypothetical protein [Planctomycetota bacterium]